MDGTTTPVTAANNTNQTATSSITKAIRDFYGNIAGTPNSQQAEGDITQFNKLTPTTASILQQFDQQYGVNDAATRVSELRKSVMNAEDLVNNVDQNVFARTSNALVSDAQRARLTAAEKDPLLKQLDIQNRSFDLANQDLTGAREQSNRFSGAELGDISTMRTSLSERLTTTQQREAAEREKAQAEEQNRQWWANYNEQKSQFERQLAESTAARKASQANIAKYDSIINQYKAEAERQKAIAAEAQKAQDEINANKNYAPGYSYNKQLSTYVPNF